MKALSRIKNIFGKKVNTPQGKQQMKYLFTSKSGYKYYMFSDSTNQINFERYHAQFTTRLVEMQNRITNASLNEWIETTRTFTSINQYRSAVEALDIRRQIAMDVNMLYELCAVLYLREDEDNAPISNDFLLEKAKDIRETIAESEDPSFFFADQELKNFLTLHDMSRWKWNSLQINLESQIKIFKEVMTQIQSKTQLN